MLALKMQKVVSFHQLPHFHFPMAEMDIQHNFSEYGLFNWALAKQLHTKADHRTRMHKDNITVSHANQKRLYLLKNWPGICQRIFINTQRRKWHEAYTNHTQKLSITSSTKKAKLSWRDLRKTGVTAEEKPLSVSQHCKRVPEYKSVPIL